VADIQVEIRRQLDQLALQHRCAGVDEDQVNIGGAAQHGIGIADERTRQIGGEDILVVEGALLDGLSGNTDQGLTGDTHDRSS